MPLPCWFQTTKQRKASPAIDSIPPLRVSLLPSRTAAALPTPSGPKGSSGNRRCRVSGPQKTATVSRCGFLRWRARRTPKAEIFTGGAKAANRPSSKILSYYSSASHSKGRCEFLLSGKPHMVLPRPGLLTLLRFSLLRVVFNHHVHLINAPHFVQMSTHGLFCQVWVALFQGFVHANVGEV